MAAGLFRLADEGLRALQVAVNQLSFFWAPFYLEPLVRGSYYETNALLKIAQLSLLAGGAAITFYAIWGLARRWDKNRPWALAAPYLALALFMTLAFLYPMILPMDNILH